MSRGAAPPAPTKGLQRAFPAEHQMLSPCTNRDVDEEDWAQYEWDVVALRANRQLARLSEICAHARRSLEAAAMRRVQRPLWGDEEQRYLWRLSNKLLRKVAMLGVLFEVLDAQEPLHPEEVKALRRRVAAAGKAADAVQQELSDRLFTSTRMKGGDLNCAR
eukprot:TRINITY_DN27217_c0_g1_i1.p1 TRINITY_DN27217_c0_g1~~TRINITY_DN27217_c0_g1_i1.p1  ORF type:complete len:178 (+),score=44.64 TRINITY_DN27217_c0_g1_i1:51-536(+)